MYRNVEHGSELLPAELAYLRFRIQLNIDEMEDVLASPVNICSQDHIEDIEEDLAAYRASLNARRAINDITIDSLVTMHEQLTA